jgi:hypothetical protein
MASWTPESCEHQDNANIHYQSFPESVSKEHDIYADYNGCHRHHVKHDSYLSAHFSTPLAIPVLIGRHGAMNPVGRARTRNIMPTVRDYSRASQSFRLRVSRFRMIARLTLWDSIGASRDPLDVFPVRLAPASPPGLSFYALSIGGHRTRRQVRRWSIGHDAPARPRSDKSRPVASHRRVGRFRCANFGDFRSTRMVRTCCGQRNESRVGYLSSR